MSANRDRTVYVAMCTVKTTNPLHIPLRKDAPGITTSTKKKEYAEDPIRVKCNLDERVSERVLYDILIQAGRVVELYVPRDKETEKSKGYAFAEYETEEIANYAVRLFSGLVTLYNRTLKFAISGQDKSSSHTSAANPSQNLRPNRPENDSAEIPQNSAGLPTPGRASAYSDNHSHASILTGMTQESNGFGSRSSGYEYTRRVFGATLESINHSRSRGYDTSNLVAYPSH